MKMTAKVWVVSSSERIRNDRMRTSRDAILQQRAVDEPRLVAAFLETSDMIDGESFGALVDEVLEMRQTAAQSRSFATKRGIYPSQDMLVSSVILMQRNDVGEDCSNFLSVLRTAYNSDALPTSTGQHIYRVNLVTIGIKNVYAFEFMEEREYWRFILGIRKGARGETVSVTGTCRNLGGVHDAPDAITNGKKGAGTRGSVSKTLLSSLVGSSPQTESVASTSPSSANCRVTIRDDHLAVRGIGVKGQLLNDEVVIDLKDLYAMALTADYTATTANLLSVRVELPDTTLQKIHDMNSIDIILTSNDVIIGQLQKMTSIVSPLLPRGLLYSSTPCNLDNLTGHFWQGGELQELTLQVKDIKSNWEIGEQTFIPNQLVVNYSTVDAGGDSPAPLIAKSPKALPNSNQRRNLHLSSMQFISEYDSPKATPKSIGNHFSADSRQSIHTPSGTVSSKQPITIPIVKINHEQRIEMDLINKGGENALKLLIKNATNLILPQKTGLFSNAPTPPTVFCTIYLVGKHNKRLTSNREEMRTDPIKSFEPIWNQTIFLQDDKVGINEVESVMVLLRDASSGVLKHKHIGQVNIPISCFLDVAADFCLPIEPSYRMDSHLSETSYIGEIHLSTQLVHGQAIHEENNKQHHPIFKVDSIRTLSFAAFMSVQSCGMVGGIWWPFKILSSVSATSSNSDNGCNGFILALPDYLHICITNSHSHSNNTDNPGIMYLTTQATQQPNGIFSLKWDKITDYEVLTDSALFLAFTLTYPHGDNSQQVESHSIELVLGPCPALQLETVIIQRIKLDKLHTQVRTLNNLKYDLTTVRASTGQSSPNNNNNRLSNTKSSFFRLSTLTSPRLSRETSTSTMALIDPGETLRSILPLFEELFNDLNKRKIGGNVKENLKKKVEKNEGILELKNGLKFQHTYLQLLTHHIRWTIAPVILTHLIAIGDGEIPDYSTSGIVRLVERDAEYYQILQPLPKTNNRILETLMELYDSFFTEILRRLRDYILFSARSTARYDEEIPRDCAQGIETLLEKYLVVLRRSLDPFIATKEIFLTQSGGQIFKNSILKLLIAKNNQLANLAERVLHVHSMHLSQGRKKLELVENVPEIMEWFSIALLQDTRTWLSRTLQSASQQRVQNRAFDLPWDVDVVGKMYCSHLPETLRLQLNVFMDLFVQDFQSSNNSNGEDDAGYSSEMKVNDTTSSTSLNTNIDSTIIMHHMANQILLQAITQAWLFLLTEYERSLQCKHWDLASKSTGEQDAYLEFLASIANDCCRIRRVHMLPLLDSVVVDVTIKSALIKSLFDCLKSITSQAVKLMARIIFSDTQQAILDFDYLWFNPSHDNSMCVSRTLSTNIRTWMVKLKQRLEYKVYRDLLAQCAEVIIMRYLLMLRETLATKNGPPLRHDDCERLKKDLDIIGHVLQDLCMNDTIVEDEAEDDDDAHHNTAQEDSKGGEGKSKTVMETIQSIVFFFQHLVVLLCATVDSEDFKASIKWLFQSYDRLYNSTHPQFFIEFMLLHVILPLRPTVINIEHDVMEKIYTKALMEANPGGYIPTRGILPVDQCKQQRDLFWRIFGLNNTAKAFEELVASHSSSSSSSRPVLTQHKSRTGILSTTTTKAHVIQPYDYFKPIKEKNTTDALHVGSVFNNVKKRENEEIAMNIMRTLGLENDRPVAVVEEAQLQAAIAQGSDGASSATGGAGENRRASRNLNGMFTLGMTGRDRSIQDLTSIDISRKNSSNASVQLAGNQHIVAVLVLKNIEAKNLQTSALFGECHPYVYFTLVGQHKAKTGVRNGTGAKVTWPENLSIKVPASVDFNTASLVVEVFDKELIRRKRSLGSVHIRLNGLDVREIDSWFALEGGEGVVSVAEIHCTIALQKLK